ncbi:hypothetical protein ACFFUB_07635 [Algimonas porphyrae]|uniref:Uncharacterized protein n=1 Tax=Algimonas porphyrae TaxID=1128113 RepID=A0ABQ5V076_9PROT|nr:hypothetical protein [Algimonas porphyrae]GLQ20955.1 hypothetical protein GCM10007854_19100 [Algimonas porphyrae]
MKPIRLTLIAALCLSSANAFADEAETDAPKAMGPEYCFPAAGIQETLAKFDSLKDKKRDTVGPEIAISLEMEEGENPPERIEIRDEAGVMPVTFDDYHRTHNLTDQLRDASLAAELCVVDPDRAGRLPTERGYAFNVGMGVRFKRTNGTHMMAEIEDGLKDGRSHYKKMVGAMGFMVPKFDHVAISGRDDANPPRVWATADGADLGEPAFELYDGARMIHIDTLEDMGADGLRIEGDYYRMSPSPDAKTVARFAGGD